VSRPFVSHLSPEQASDSPEDRDEFHADSARTHFIDLWTHRAMLARLDLLSGNPTVVDVGCSAGYLLEDLHHAIPEANLIGVDLAAEGLRKAHENVPDATLLQADVCALPLDDACADAAVSANVLEHVADDERALAEIIRILRPGGRAVIVVPAGPSNYDYYDRFLGHMRRYARGELARKAQAQGFDVLDELHLGSLLYPAFWAVKHRNRLLYAHLQGDALSTRVSEDIRGTKDSGLGRAACLAEERLLSRGIKLPFGIRSLVVLARPQEGP